MEYSWRGSHFSYEDSTIISPSHYAHFAEQVAFLDDERIAHLIISCFEGPGMRFYTVSTGEGLPYISADDTAYLIEAEWYESAERRSAHAVLVSLGIIREFNADNMYFEGERYLDVNGVHLTEFGVDFLLYCSDFDDRKYVEMDLIIDRENESVRIEHK